ncbi:MAG: SUMF1/EgtB/PvdO family nonheme iron enzyme [Deltaproteobacteria bacterium]|nr:SUMF1/EgtB/PvdO family nonheme iron enzyme [Deltaproteobacteria bacterium]MBN2672682.1 SUMF1/EgtB/PvdO family nonheme iron enzyme [Deltaproteobacteria bacterium]
MRPFSIFIVFIVMSTGIPACAPPPAPPPQKESKPPAARRQQPHESVAIPPPEPQPEAPPEDMIRVPGGTFTMGLNHPRAIPDEQTEHEVTLRAFYLDTTEVTNEAYNACVEAGVCAPPKELDTTKSGFEALRYFRRPLHPVTGVSRQDALTYCNWKGKRLPTEAEFERAARGDDGRMYAWGDDPPSDTRAVYASKVTKDVGSKPEGAGPYGHLDLAGNVWEWTADLYDPFAYMRSTANQGIPADCATIKKTQDQLRSEGKQGFTGTNPIPFECDHVLRGGAFNYFAWGLRASNRVHHPESWKMAMAGFRCAEDTE